MKLTTVKEIYKNREEYLNREVTVGGWVRSVRGSKAFGFIVLHQLEFQTAVLLPVSEPEFP